MMYELPISRLDELFEAIAGKEKLYLPADTEPGLASWTEWQKGLKLSQALNTVRSAKDLFFPQTQNLVDFRMNGKKIEIIDTRREAEDFVAFGVRACDVRSFAILDRVFLAEPEDTYYATRRRHGTIVSLACSRPEETCFCRTFGVDAARPAGDARCWAADEKLLLEPLTEKGRALAESLGGLLKECPGDEADRQIAETEKLLEKLPLSGLKTKDLTKKELEVFNSPLWAELSQSCLGCGACTFVCPTCQCFDIRDFDTGRGVERYRCWDSCMYSDFTQMAAANPRRTQTERFRQRFMHKLVYFPEKNDGVFGCVGCGRCLRKCPVSMNIVKVMKSIGGDEE